VQWHFCKYLKIHLKPGAIELLAAHHHRLTACPREDAQLLACCIVVSCWHRATASLAHIWTEPGRTSSFFFPTATIKLLIPPAKHHATTCSFLKLITQSHSPLPCASSKPAHPTLMCLYRPRVAIFLAPGQRIVELGRAAARALRSALPSTSKHLRFAMSSCR
jgi:hypothetical protein